MSRGQGDHDSPSDVGDAILNRSLQQTAGRFDEAHHWYKTSSLKRSYLCFIDEEIVRLPECPMENNNCHAEAEG